ncbi:Phospholipase A and acyltransferase 5 [Manis javanica]|nr:Phospholipase A and acyltransferase 5 [Manis javanica]
MAEGYEPWKLCRKRCGPPLRKPIGQRTSQYLTNSRKKPVVKLETTPNQETAESNSTPKPGSAGKSTKHAAEVEHALMEGAAEAAGAVLSAVVDGMRPKPATPEGAENSKQRKSC